MTSGLFRAAMPMAPEGAWLLGERGLTGVNICALIIGATEDVDSDPQREAVDIFQSLGTGHKSVIALIDKDHMMICDQQMIARMTHLAVAFFVCPLQDHQDLARHFSPEFNARHGDLARRSYHDE
jgi:hypothetical protein